MSKTKGACRELERVGVQSMIWPRPYAIAALSALVALVALAIPAGVQAHGPVAPIASSYLARVGSAPPGLEAKVIDGDQRMWVSAPASSTVVVMDYRAVPYLRFSHSGVEVNENSEMYYLNQTPAELPPSNITVSAPSRWSRVSDGHAYGWHDGRLHALAAVAIAPGTSYVGRWRIPLRVDGHLSSISGGMWHAGSPSIVWFWPIVVLIACTLAAWRLRRPDLDAHVARLLGFAALIGTATAAAGAELRGRPTLAVSGVATFAIVAAFVAWAVRQLLWRRPTHLTYFGIALVSLWGGAELIPTLLHGFVLAAVPALAARTAAVVCLGCGVGLLIIPSRLARVSRDEHSTPDERSNERSTVRGSYA
jgi:hypothetical protein